ASPLARRQAGFKVGETGSMVSTIEPLESALARADATQFADREKTASEERGELLRRFPRDHWPEMTLEEYALGHEDSEDSFCRWMEFKSQALGSIRGGS